jgi:SSS family solute:Na+ symporter
MGREISQLAIVLVFMAIALFIGLRGYRFTRREPEDYFLASRSLGTLVLLLTMFATLMSAFTFFGGAGQVYSTGMEWLLVMGVMDGFLVALLWYVIGSQQWKLGQRHRYMTLGEMLEGRFGSCTLRIMVSLVSLFWLFPYLMLQQMGAGYALAGLTRGVIPYSVGAGLITIFMLIYVVLGGMRGVAWTDTFQGILMLVCIWLALIFMGRALGGPVIAASKILSQAERVFTLGDPWTPQMMWSAAVSTALGVICFPQINQRFFAGKSEEVLQKSFILWPLLCLLLFFPAFLIGAWGAGIVPGLERADTVLSVMLDSYTPFWFSALIISGAMAAMMSSSDSMLLSASSYLTHDIYKRVLNAQASNEREDWVGRLLVALFAILAYLASLLQPGSLVGIGLVAFGGFAQLTPLLFLSLYWKRTTATGMIAALLISEGFYMGSKFIPGIPASYWGWDSSIIGIIMGTILVFLVSSLSSHSPKEKVQVFFSE